LRNVRHTIAGFRSAQIDIPPGTSAPPPKSIFRARLADRGKVEGRKHEALEAPAIATILP
jgi:hypothetical protein